MVEYPHTEYWNKGIIGSSIIAFDKLDGSNIRAEFHVKKGWIKYGSRQMELNEKHPSLFNIMWVGEIPCNSYYNSNRWQIFLFAAQPWEFEWISWIALYRLLIGKLKLNIAFMDFHDRALTWNFHRQMLKMQCSYEIPRISINFIKAKCIQQLPNRMGINIWWNRP